MLFSIIVPIYNVENYLKKCIDSIINQTYRDIEIILVDDGSPDNCPAMCDEYAKTDDRIKVIHKKNGGLSDARNAGLEIASGEYIMFVDSDDYIESDACERFSKFIVNEENVDLYVGYIKNTDETRYSVKSSADIGAVYNGSEYYFKFNNSIIPTVVSTIYRRKFLFEQNIKFMVGKYHEDNEFTPRVYIKAEKVVFTDIGFYIYLVRSDSITQKKDKRKNLTDIIEISHSLLKFSDGLENSEVKKVLKNNICNSYLSLFYETNIFQYKDKAYRQYIDKKLVLKTAMTKYNKLRCLLFCLSPKLYLKVRTMKKD